MQLSSAKMQTMTLNSDKRNTASPNTEDESLSDSEKTIPFLRRLTDMLIENEDVISFNPGSRKHGKVVLGRIVVHDRAQVESRILPRYFNHSSFASLRRQLNYFNFTRIGKGRQRGATYCNEGVVEIGDILSLKRRTNNSGGSGTNVTPAHGKAGNSVTGGGSDGVVTVASDEIPGDLIKSGSKSKKTKSNKRTHFEDGGATPSGLKTTPSRVSPVDHFGNDAEHPKKRISLDLTGPIPAFLPPSGDTQASILFDNTTYNADDEILAGCKLLIGFSRGIPSR